MEKWIDFYERHFPTRSAAADFVAACEAGSDAARVAMLIMHQTQRLVTLADDITKVRPKDSLRLLFLEICAETVAKLHDKFTEDGRSKAYTQKFFEDFVCAEDKEKLENGFEEEDANGIYHGLKLKQVVDRLYAIRCDVVHEGRYWEFHFRTDEFTACSGEPLLGVSVAYQEFRDIIVRAAIAATRSRLPKATNGKDAA